MKEIKMEIKMEIKEADLKYFTAAALSGICANPSFMTPEGKKYLQMKGINPEKLAVMCALQVMLEIKGLQKVMENEGKIKIEEEPKP